MQVDSCIDKGAIISVGNFKCTLHQFAIGVDLERSSEVSFNPVPNAYKQTFCHKTGVELSSLSLLR